MKYRSESPPYGYYALSLRTTAQSIRVLADSNGLRELNAIGGERKTARQVPRRLVCRFQSANRTEVQTLFSVLLYGVIVGVVVVPILGDFTTRIVEHRPNHSCADVDQLLVRSFSGDSVGLACPYDQENAVRERG